jgi:hypothetical protein
MGIVIVGLDLFIFGLSLVLASESIHNGGKWNDTDKKVIESHSAGILIDPVDNSYWWFGESHKTSNLSDHGVNCYHSRNLIDWTNMGQVLRQAEVKVESYPGPYIIARPKVLWNKKTQLFVMWFHLDNSNHRLRFVGVATSPSPSTAFTFLRGFQPDGIPSLDMSLYEDKRDGLVQGAYLVRSCNNQYVGISRLTDDYMNTTGLTSTIDEPREGHTIFHRNDHYYMMTSHMSSWAPNVAELFITDRDSLQDAKWISLGNPSYSNSTLSTQLTYVPAILRVRKSVRIRVRV